MHRCIQLAKNGLGTTYPNPLVGSLIVHNTKIIGEGWHFQAGQPHAEVNAINSVSAISLFSEATLYVSLEPCSHFGKTPPCADLIISNGIKKVVIGTTDPNPKVAGQGIKKLLEAGCDVVVGVLEAECNELNKRFFTFQQKKRPYIILKWAQSSDGFIAPEKRTEQKPVWITNAFSRQLAHKLRSQEQAILVGTNTVRADNPTLTTRSWYGTTPIRTILDSNLSLSHDLNIFNDQAPTLILTERKQDNTKHITFETVDFTKELPQHICTILYQKMIQSMIIEGGTQTLQTFIDANLWDEALLFEGAPAFVNGLKAPTIAGKLVKTTPIVTDLLFQYKNTAH